MGFQVHKHMATQFLHHIVEGVLTTHDVVTTVLNVQL